MSSLIFTCLASLQASEPSHYLTHQIFLHAKSYHFKDSSSIFIDDKWPELQIVLLQMFNHNELLAKEPRKEMFERNNQIWCYYLMKITFLLMVRV